MKNLVVRPDYERESEIPVYPVREHRSSKDTPVSITIVQPESHRPKDIARIAGEAFVAIKAQQDEHGNNIAMTYAEKNDVVNIKNDVEFLKAKDTIENADKAENANKAVHDSEGNKISETYAKQSELKNYVSQSEMGEKVSEVEKAAMYGAKLIIDSLTSTFANNDEIDSLF